MSKYAFRIAVAVLLTTMVGLIGVIGAQIEPSPAQLETMQRERAQCTALEKYIKEDPALLTVKMVNDAMQENHPRWSRDTIHVSSAVLNELRWDQRQRFYAYMRCRELK